MSDSVTKYWEQNPSQEKTEKEVFSDNVQNIIDLFVLLQPLEKVQVLKQIREIKIF